MVDNKLQSIDPKELGVEIPQDNRGYISWATLQKDPLKLKEVIESIARSFLLISGERVITQKGLTKTGFSTIAHAVSKYYPGSYHGLRQNLSNPEGSEVEREPSNKKRVALLTLRGKLRWTLPGNTPEQNEQLGISNIQSMFLKRFPEFDELFFRDGLGKVLVDKQDAAKDFILGRIDSKRRFGEVFSQSAYRRRHAPYFENSFLVALKKSFKPWGIDLQISSQVQVDGITVIPLVYDQRGRVRWSVPGNSAEENAHLAIRNIQGIFLTKFPDFNSIFPRSENGQIDVVKRQEAVSFILNKVGGYRKFQKVFGTTPLAKADIPFFEGSHAIALRKAFGPWGIVFTIEDFKNRRGFWLGINSAVNVEQKVISSEDADEVLGRLTR